jgi:subtilisin-like proprotein convertase family protein
MMVSYSVRATLVALSLFALLGSAAHAQTTFSNPALITLNDDPTAGNDGTVGPATPYPSPINVAGLSGVISKVTATLNGINHTFLRDLDILLVGPGGQSVILMSDVGGGTTVSNLVLTFDDAAASPIFVANPPASGSWRPSNSSEGPSEEPDVFPAPAPAGPYGGALSVFNGAAPNGTYSLFIVDDGLGDTGTITNGWSITITTVAVEAAAPEPATAGLCLMGLIGMGGLRYRRKAARR